MPNTIYDVAVIGAGVSGASIARTLAAYRIKTVLLEKEADVCFGVSKANSGIIHAGFHHAAGTLKSRLEIRGNLMFEKLHHELKFPFERMGILVVAFSPEQMNTVRHLYEQGMANGVPGLEVCGAERIRQLEPMLNPDAVGGLYAPTGGIIEPYRYVFALCENAAANGTVIRTGFEVVKSAKNRGMFTITSTGGDQVRARYAVNAAGLYADRVSGLFRAERFTITPRKGEEYLLDRNAAGHPRHILFPVPVKNSKGMLVIPTPEGTTMVGPTAEEVTDKEGVTTTADNLDAIFTNAAHMVPAISRTDIITAFAGMRPVLKGNDFYIDISRKEPRLVQVAGIQSPGLTASPAIGEYVKDLLKKAGLCLTEKTDFISDNPGTETVFGATREKIRELVARDPAYGNIVCRCETVSEAQIVEAIRKGHTTLDGIKFYTRAGMGRCQGGFCTYRILKILARETGRDIRTFTKRGPGSEIVTGKLGELS